MIGGADFSTTFSGGYASDRVPDDPDAPIRTARYEELPAPAVLANASPVSSEPTGSAAIVLAGGDVVEPVPPGRQITLADVSPGRARSPTAVAASLALAGGLPEHETDRPAFTQRAGQTAPGRLALSVTTNETPFAPGSGLNFSVRGDDNPASMRIPQRTRLFDTRRWGLTFDLSPEESRKGRWYLFAATSGDAFGFNLFGDPARSGTRKNRWSVEKLAEYGKAQLGVGWRKGSTQVSVAATQREIGAYGYSREDTVFGVSFTISGGKRLPPPKTRRGIPRE